MIQIGWEAPSDDPAALVTQLASAPATPPSAWPTPLRASPAPDPFLAPVAPVVERTMAIDLSASGMAPPPSPPWSSPGLAPHGWTPPPSPASILAPPPVPAHTQLYDARPLPEPQRARVVAMPVVAPTPLRDLVRRSMELRLRRPHRP